MNARREDMTLEKLTQAYGGDSETSVAGIATIAVASWPEPQPLPVTITPEPYPIDALPTIVKQAVEEVAGFSKAPLPLVVSSALAALSLTIQPHVDVKRAEKLTGPASLFLLTIADSGERKSTCDGFFTTAIRDYEAVQAETAKLMLKDYEVSIEAWDSKRLGINEKIRQLSKDSKPTHAMETALRELEHSKPEAPKIPRLFFCGCHAGSIGVCAHQTMAIGWRVIRRGRDCF